MSKEEIITAIAVTTDKTMLSRIADVIHHKENELANKPESETRLITQREAARRLGISYTTVWRLIREGRLLVVDVRGKQRVRLDSVMKFAGVA